MPRHCESWHCNDGDGLDATDAACFADLLDQQLAGGQAAAYVGKRAAQLATLPEFIECPACNGTGTPQLAFAAIMRCQRDDDRCAPCDGTGKRLPIERNYELDEDVIREFASFARTSGGFEIW